MKNPRTPYDWVCRDRVLRLGDRTRVMGILNVTPDSFSDGGSYSDPSAAVDRALEMAAQGADIIDIGGESTRPGADPVSAAEELRRTVLVIERIRAQSDVFISIDTMKGEVAARAIEAGADIINDVSAFETDSTMPRVAVETQAGVVLMHMKGSPQTMQDNPDYDDVVTEVAGYLQGRIEFAAQYGVERNRIVLDPGIGFGKTIDHNLALLRGLPELVKCGSPILVGASRKSFIGEVLGREHPEDRRSGSLGAAAWCAVHGAHILRVHDVIETCDVCRVLDRLALGEH